MFRRLSLALAAFLLTVGSAVAQQAPPQPPQQPLTFWYDYTVKPGREADFLNLVKMVGQPVRDKLMADGVVMAWGLEVPVLRLPDRATHTIWYAVADMAGVEKVQNAMAAQLAKIAADDLAKKLPKGMTTAERTLEIIDASKTRDWLTRDVVINLGTGTIPAGTLPYTGYTSVKAWPGKGGDYRRAWEKYTKPVYDKLVADGTVLGFGLGVEAVKTTDDFTHFIWVVTKDLASRDKIRAAFIANQDSRTEEARDAIGEIFAASMDGSATRQMITRSLIFKVAGQK